MNLVKSIVNFLINPIHVIFILIIIMIWAYYWGRVKALKRMAFGTGIFFLLSATYPLPDFVIGQLENRYQPLLDTQHLQEDSTLKILVLGSGHTVDPDLPPTDQLSATALKRLVEGIRLVEDLPKSRLIVSGYAGTHSAVSQARVLSAAAEELGLSKERINLQELPSTTSEEAQAFVTAFGTEHKLVLVTSASHMPRAVNIFERKGITVIPAPTDFKIKRESEERWGGNLFSHQNFYKIQLALHEYIGMLWEKVRS